MGRRDGWEVSSHATHVKRKPGCAISCIDVCATTRQSILDHSLMINHGIPAVLSTDTVPDITYHLEYNRSLLATITYQMPPRCRL